MVFWVGNDAWTQQKPSDNKKKQKQLEQERKKKEKEIQLTRKLLNQTQHEKKKSLSQLRLLNKQIRIREELIHTVNSEIDELDDEILIRKTEIEELEKSLEKRKQEYADMVYLAYKSKRVFDPVIFVLSAPSFHQASRRMEFMRSLSESRTEQLRLITEAREKINAELASLEMVRDEKTALLGKQQNERTELEKDKNEEGDLVKSLQQKEKQLRKDLAEKQKAARKLDAEIKRIIAEELERARKEEEARRKKTGEKKSTDMALTPEAAALSANFASNKGKLPWPVEKGFIIRSFGEHRHPTLPNVKTVNNGVDIVTTDGARARAVFEGEVRAIFNVPGMQNAVMINHGEFYTVYTHLETVTVKKGDKVTTKQALGTIYKNPDDAKTILHFELWRGNAKQDPESWIYAK